jgi:phosphinothricin acetyltransferase
MQVRACTLADLEAVQSIYAHYVRTGLASFEEDPPSVEELQRRFTVLIDDGFPFLVIQIGARVAGYAYASPFRPRSAYRYTCESSVYVAPDMQRRGVGRTLMLQLIEHAERCGKRQMLAVIGDSANLASIALHAALGFELVGTFKSIGFKFQRWVDVVLMQRELHERKA